MRRQRDQLTILVTGASSGLGYALALALAVRGHRVVAVARRRSILNRLARRTGGLVLPCAADLRLRGDLTKVIRLVQRLGGVDVLVNNAAVYHESRRPWRISEKVWRTVIGTNMRAPLFLASHLVRTMAARGGGLIINVVSGTTECSGVLLYRSTKIALEVLTQAIAEDASTTSVAACSFNPGWMHSGMSSGGRNPAHPARALASFIESRSRHAINGRTFDYQQNGSTRGRIVARARRRGAFGRSGR